LGALVVAASIALAGCTAAPPPPPPPVFPAGVGLPEGRAFVLSFTGARAGPWLIAPVKVEVGTRGHLHVETGCNPLTATGAVVDQLLVLTAVEVASRICAPDLMEQEANVLKLFRGGPSLVIDRGLLHVVSEQTYLPFVDMRDAQADHAIVGARWRVRRATGDEGSYGSTGSAITFADGRVQYRGGCQDHDGTVTIAPGTITVGVLSPTGPPRACMPGSDEPVLAVLRGPLAAVVTGRHLRLDQPGERGLLLEAMGTDVPPRLHDQRIWWASTATTACSFTATAYCFCLPHSYDVTVRPGRPPVRRVHAKYAVATDEYPLTIEALFDWIEDLYATEDSVSVEYDSRLGFPSSISAGPLPGPNQSIIDGGFTLKLTEFVPLA
jgi:heat shock protein HslJ